MRVLLGACAHTAQIRSPVCYFAWGSSNPRPMASLSDRSGLMRLSELRWSLPGRSAQTFGGARTRAATTKPRRESVETCHRCSSNRIGYDQISAGAAPVERAAPPQPRSRDPAEPAGS